MRIKPHPPLVALWRNRQRSSVARVGRRSALAHWAALRIWDRVQGLPYGRYRRALAGAAVTPRMRNAWRVSRGARHAA